MHVFKGVAAGMSDYFLGCSNSGSSERVVGCRREVVKVEELKNQRKNRSTRTG